MGFTVVPLHQIILKSSVVTGRVAVGVRESLPIPDVSFILGNDLADGNVWNRGRRVTQCKVSYSSRSSSRATNCKVYVGGLGNGAAKGELARAFSYYGPLRSVWVARKPPGFAFVEYEDARDAEDAVKGMDGKVLCGAHVRVELSTGMSRKSCYGRPSCRQFEPNNRCYQCGESVASVYDLVPDRGNVVCPDLGLVRSVIRKTVISGLPAQGEVKHRVLTDLNTVQC
ncbi:hypothetical protein PO909_022128 [Leuciscus waleckii]